MAIASAAYRQVFSGVVPLTGAGGVRFCFPFRQGDIWTVRRSHPCGNLSGHCQPWRPNPWGARFCVPLACVVGKCYPVPVSGQVYQEKGSPFALPPLALPIGIFYASSVRHWDTRFVSTSLAGCRFQACGFGRIARSVCHWAWSTPMVYAIRHGLRR